MRLLLIEDNVSQQMALTAILRREAYDVAPCANLPAAADLIRTGPFAIAIVAWDLCGPAGIESLRELDPASTETRFISYTGFGSFRAANDAVSSGVFAHLEELSDPVTLLNCVHRAANDYLNQVLKQTADSLRFKQFTLDRVDEAVYWMTADSKFTDVNDSACRMTGYTREELLSMKVSDLDPDLPVESWPVTWQRIRSSHSWIFESRHRRKDGQFMPVEIRANHLMHEGQEFNCSIVRDISRRKATEFRLRRTEHLAALGTLAAGIAHEINNPLSAAWTAVETAKAAQHGPRGARVVAESLDAICSAVQSCRLIIGNMLRFARLEPSKKTPAAVSDVVRNTVKTAAHFVHYRGSTLVTELSDELPLVLLNTAEMEQVLVNLIRNAVQAGKRTAICVGTGCSEGAVLVTVRDNGRGIPPANVERIFDPFFSDQDNCTGTGLGLAISHRIVEEHGGTIDVQSSLGKGTTFTLRFPAMEEPRPSSPDI